MPDVIRGFIEAGVVKKYDYNSLADGPFLTPKMFGAKGDGQTDDTASFANALNSIENGGTLFVPAGEYLLSDTIRVNQSKTLMLDGAATLFFTCINKPCIKVNRYARLVGNGALMFVPYNFSDHALECYTDEDPANEDEWSVTPLMGATPLWRLQRQVDNLGIIKCKSATSRQALLSSVSNIGGDAVYIGAENVVGTNISANSNSQWMTRVNAMVAGGFENGFHVEVVDDETAWISDTFISGIAESCETGVLIENVTGGVYCDVFVQPHPTAADSGGNRVAYAKNGIKVVNTPHVDMSRSRVWDWRAGDTLRTGYPPSDPNQAYALIGTCTGAIINDFGMHNSLNTNYNRIYTDNPDNLITAAIISAKGFMPPPPKYAFYKNYRQGNNIYNQNNVSWRDPINMHRYDVPVLPLNAYANPNNLYKIGSFSFTDVENPVDGFVDVLATETITIEEVDSRGIYGYTNLNFTESSAKAYWNPIGFGYGGRAPIYFYSVDGTTRTIYKLVRDAFDIQNIFNCKVSISNARRFLFEYESVGPIANLSSSTYIMMPPQYADGAELFFEGTTNAKKGKPYICTQSAEFGRDGTPAVDPVVKQLACKEDVPNIVNTVYDYENQILISTDSSGNLYNNSGYKAGYALNNSGEEITSYEDNFVTGFIPVTQGDVIRVKDPSGRNFDSNNIVVAFYGASKETATGIGKYVKDLLGQSYYGSITISGDTLVWDTQDISYYFWNDFSYMRIFTHSDESIITVNEQITNNVIGYKAKPTLTVYGQNLVLESSTPNSTKKFNISVNDAGTITATEIT